MTIDYPVDHVHDVEIFAAHLAQVASTSEVIAALGRAFPWAKYLNDGERVQFATDIEASLPSPADFMRAVQSWFGTAENYAEGIVPTDDLEWLSDLPVVARPA